MKHSTGYFKEVDYRANIEYFDSANELVRVCNKRPHLRGNKDSLNMFDLDKDWYGVKDSTEAFNLLANGWNDNVQGLIKSMNKVNTNGYSKRTSFKNDVVGFAPIVPLALLGVPTSMQNSYMKPIKAKIIDIIYDVTVNYGHSAHEILENGKKICEVVLALEKQGYRVRLSAMQAYSGHCDGDILVVKVKDEAQPIDLKRIAFPLTHPAMFRVIGFAWYERVPSGKWRSSYGKPLAQSVPKEKLQELVNNCISKTGVYISGTLINYKSIEEIQDMLVENAKKVVAR